MQAVKIRIEEGQFAAVLGKPGRMYTPFVMVEFPVRKRRIANIDVEKYTRPLFKGKGNDPYPIKRAANHMLRIGRKHGITKGARDLLNAARSYDHS